MHFVSYEFLYFACAFLAFFKKNTPSQYLDWVYRGEFLGEILVCRIPLRLNSGLQHHSPEESIWIFFLLNKFT